MNPDDIIRMGREAGLIVDEDATLLWKEGTNLEPFLVRFANLVAAAEREACAKVCESAGPGAGPVYCAFAIRERGAP